MDELAESFLDEALKKVTITIEGASGSGKTRLLNLIGYLLKERGFNVSCCDDTMGEVIPGMQWETAQPQVDQRMVYITTIINDD